MQLTLVLPHDAMVGSLRDEAESFVKAHGSPIARKVLVAAYVRARTAGYSGPKAQAFLNALAANKYWNITPTDPDRDGLFEILASVLGTSKSTISLVYQKWWSSGSVAVDYTYANAPKVAPQSTPPKPVDPDADAIDLGTIDATGTGLPAAALAAYNYPEYTVARFFKATVDVCRAVMSAWAKKGTREVDTALQDSLKSGAWAKVGALSARATLVANVLGTTQKKVLDTWVEQMGIWADNKKPGSEPSVSLSKVAKYPASVPGSKPIVKAVPPAGAIDDTPKSSITDKVVEWMPYVAAGAIALGAVWLGVVLLKKPKGAGGMQPALANPHKRKSRAKRNPTGTDRDWRKDIQDWEAQNLDKSGRYTGPDLTRWGFAYRVGEYVPVTERYSAMSDARSAKARKAAREQSR